MTDAQLTKDEVRELLPLLIAGTLAPEMRAQVEAAIRGDAELQDDLKFWMTVSRVTHLREDSNTKGHPSTELLVAYGEQPEALEPTQRQEVIDHLRECPACREHAGLVRETYAALRPTGVWRYAAAAVIVLGILGTLLTVWPLRESKTPDTRVVVARIPFVEYYRSSVPDTATLVRIDIFPRTDSITLQVEIPLPHTKTMPLRWSIRGPGAGWIEYQGASQGRATSDGYYVEWQEFGESSFPLSGRYTLKAQSPEDGDFYYDFEVVRH